MKDYFSLLLLPLFLSYMASAIAETPIQANLSASYTSDDNITRSTNYYEVSDSILGLDASVSYQIPINISSFFSLKASMAINRYQDFDKLSNTRPGIQASYHIRPTSGYTATRYSLSLGYEKRMYDSEQREGSAIDIAMSAHKRVTDRISLRAGISKESVSANEKVFESDNTRLYLDANYKLTENNTLYLTFGSYEGDIASTSIYSKPPYAVRDDAFLDLSPARYTYSISVRMSSLTFGDSYAIGSNQAIDVSAYIYDASATDYLDDSIYGYSNGDYTGTIYNISYLYRF